MIGISAGEIETLTGGKAENVFFVHTIQTDMDFDGSYILIPGSIYDKKTASDQTKNCLPKILPGEIFEAMVNTASAPCFCVYEEKRTAAWFSGRPSKQTARIPVSSICMRRARSRSALFLCVIAKRILKTACV